MNVGWIEDTLMRAFRFNPCVAVHELRLRTRKHGPYTDPLACALLCAIGLAVTLYIQSQTPGPIGDRLSGRPAFHVVVFAELTLLIIILPTYAAAAIAMEREKQTLEMLRFTLLSPADVITGKLVPLLAVAAMLLVASLPIATWCLTLGGVSPGDLFFAYTLLFVLGLWAATVGLLCSALSQKMQTAQSSAIGLILGFMFVPPLVLAVMEARMRGHGSTVLPILVAIAVVCLVLVVGWYVFAWVRRAIRAYYAGPAAYVLTAAAGLLGLAVVGLFALAVSGFAARPQPEVLLVGFEPFLALWGVLNPDELAGLGPVPSNWAFPLGAMGAQLQIWIAAVGMYLAMAWACWAIAVAAFRMKGATAG